MTATELWLISGGIILLAALGAGWWWFARDQQRIRQQRRYELDSSNETRSIETSIHWTGGGSNNTSTASPESRIHWGEPEIGFDSVEINSSETDDDRVKCPYCNRKMNEQQIDAYICPQPDCHTVYHQHCWREFGGICQMCQEI